MKIRCSYFLGVPFLKNHYGMQDQGSCWVLPMGNSFSFSHFFNFSINTTGSLERVEYCSKFFDVLFK